MKDIQQLIKKNNQEGRYSNIFPKSYTEAIQDKETGECLNVTLQKTNFLFLSYNGSEEDTRLQVPYSMRRKGLWISYVTLEGSIISNFYNGEGIGDAQWKDSNNWISSGIGDIQEIINDIKDWVNSYISDLISTAVTNATKLNPEDLSKNSEGEIQLTDRDSTNGMGYVILRKNKTFAEQVTKENTIYEIRYDFDLNGATITIPEGCTLDFQGGSFRNGSIVGNNTKVRAGLDKIFNLDVEGSWDIPEAYPEWFGGVGNNNIDCSQAIQKCLSAFSCVFLSPNKKYKLTTPIVLNNNYRITGGGFSSQLTGDPECYIKGEKDNSDYLKDIIMRDFAIIGNGTNIGMNLGNISLSSIYNVTIWTTKQGVIADDIWQVSFTDVVSRNLPADNPQDIGFQFTTGTSVILSRCWARNCKIGFSLGALQYSTLISSVTESFTNKGFTKGQQVTYISCGAEAATLQDDAAIFECSYRQCSIIGAYLLGITSVASSDKPSAIVRCVGANMTVSGIRGENAVSGENVVFCKATDWGTVNLFNNLVSTVGSNIIESNASICNIRGSNVSGSPLTLGSMPLVGTAPMIGAVVSSDNNTRLIKFADGTFICFSNKLLNGTSLTTPYNKFGLTAFTTESSIYWGFPENVNTVFGFCASIQTLVSGSERDAFVLYSNAYTGPQGVWGIRPIVSESIGASNNLILNLVAFGTWK